MKTSRVLSVVIYLLDKELIKFNSLSILKILKYKFKNLYFVMQAVTRKSKMIKSPIQMYKNGHNWSMLMLRPSGIEPSTLWGSTCAFCRHVFKTLLSCSVEGGYRQSIYMFASPWSMFPISCHSCRSFCHFCLESKWWLPCSKDSNTVRIVSQINSVYSLLPHIVRLFNIIITTLRSAKW
jgi:hypothetical protein